MNFAEKKKILLLLFGGDVFFSFLPLFPSLGGGGVGSFTHPRLGQLDVCAGVTDSEQGKFHTDIRHISQRVDLHILGYNIIGNNFVSSTVTHILDKVANLKRCRYERIGRGTV